MRFQIVTTLACSSQCELCTFRELVRWLCCGKLIVAETLTKFPKGQMGYVYKLPDTLEALGNINAMQDTHVKLVGHRKMVSLACQMSQK